MIVRGWLFFLGQGMRWVACALILSVLGLPARAEVPLQEEGSGATRTERQSGSTTADHPATANGEHKSNYEKNEPGFGGPNAVNAQLEEDDRVTEPVIRLPGIDAGLQPWYAFKGRLKENYGFQFSFDYNSLYQALHESLTEENAAWSGAARVYGNWTLVGRGTKNRGSLVWNVNHRHPIGTELAPSQLGSEAGYVGITGTLFSDVNLVLVDLNWQQSFNGGRSAIIAGRFDPNDYITVLGYVNPWTTFSNAWILLNPSLAFPDGSIGIGGGSWLNDQWYVKGSINDANGVVTELDAFKGGAEFFKWGEVGWSPSRTEFYTRNVHLAVWHVDEREEAGVESAHGAALGANWTREDGRWMGFVRAGWSNGSAPTYNQTVTVGLLRYFRRNSDLLGFAVNWGNPPDDSLRDQTTMELFYRLRLSQNLAITPSLQYLGNPALNPEKDSVWLLSLRVRLAL